MKAVRLHRKQMLERLLKYPLQQLQRNIFTNDLIIWKMRRFGYKEKASLKHLQQFPDAQKLFWKCVQFNFYDSNFKNSLMNELLSEFDVNTKLFSLHGAESEYILNVDVKILKKHDLLTSISTEKLVGYLEPFPYKEPVWSSDLTINHVRNSIEEQYLAWKLGKDPKLIKYVLLLLYPCLYVGRSLQNVKRTLTMLEKVEIKNFQDVSYLIYQLNKIPFNFQSAVQCKRTLLGVPWDKAAVMFPKLMRTPYSYVMLIISILQKKNFSVNQILNGLPFVTHNITHFLRRLDFLLSSPVLSGYRNRKDFLVLLHYNHKFLMEEVASSGNDPKQLKHLFEVNIPSKSRNSNVSHLYYELHKSLNISDEVFADLNRHPQFRTFHVDNVKSTLNYLQGKGFTDEEILESVPILLYSRDKIEASLEKIKEEKDSLAEFGFKDGWVSEETTTFARGTKLKNKTLQLCLYFIEKDYDFTGQGVFSRTTDEDDLDPVK